MHGRIKRPIKLLNKYDPYESYSCKGKKEMQLKTMTDNTHLDLYADERWGCDTPRNFDSNRNYKWNFNHRRFAACGTWDGWRLATKVETLSAENHEAYRRYYPN